MQLELLAPAKDKNIGIAAINCGADAVYIGGPLYGARESANNTFEDIKELVDYAHKFKAKVYMVLNTILFDDELKIAQDYIWEAYTIGCDAIIVQDLGITKMDLPPIDLFASTQTNIRTVEQAVFLESLGFKRLILARELSLNQIKEIRQATSCELESFVHGSICVSYSGQCYLSQYLCNKSANRGKCTQPCRSNYDLIDKNNKFIIKNQPLLSLRDLNLSNHLGDLVKAGISSFKIEGRLKNISYVKNIVRHYRQKIEELGFTTSSLGSIYGGFIPNPSSSFNRGFTTYFLEEDRSDWQSKESTKSIGEFIGTIGKVHLNDGKRARFEYKSKHSLSNGDGLLIIPKKGSSFGVRLDVAEKEIIQTKYIPDLSPGSLIYRNLNIRFEKELEDNPARLIPTMVDILTTDSSICVKASAGPFVATYNLLNLETAKNKELAYSNLISQISKTSDIFKFHISDIKNNGIPFLPTSVINEIRRLLARDLGAQISSTPRPESKNQIPSKIIPPKQLTYLNCSNKLSRRIYNELNINALYAYELDPRLENELMRTKYCIKYELNLCPKHKDSAIKDYKNHFEEPYYLVNQNNKFLLKFDCKLCEMIIVQS